MTADFLGQNATMALVFAVAVGVGLFSRRMERSDWLILVAIPPIAFVTAIVPGIIAFGFDKNSATYVLGALVVIVVATVNYRFQPKPSEAAEKAARESNAAPRVAEEV